MTFADWVAETRERIDEYGVVNGGSTAVEAFWEGALARVGEHVYNYGTPVWDREWDVLLVLDTCRPDVLGEVAGGYDYLPTDVPTHTSAASASVEWVEKNFLDDRYARERRQTAYVTGNLFSENVDPDEVAVLDEVWTYGWSNEVLTTPPEVMADRAIAVGREHDPEKMVVHFMQPHAPYRTLLERHPEWFNAPNREEGEDPSHPAWVLWERLRHGEISREEVWAAYRDNLHWVLEDGVNLLLKNLDADRVVVTSDHGESFGEGGIYAHPPYVPLPVLKKVPWVETTAEDRRSYEPRVEPETTTVEGDELEDRLQALGYK
jgi:hypothetical protein